MPTNVCTPFFKPGNDITGHLTTDIGGKRFVAPVAGGRGSQPHIAVCAAGAAPCGVLGHDGVLGENIHFNVAGEVPVVAGADITAGTRVEVGAGGTAVPLATGVPAGLAMTNAASGGAVAVLLNIG